MPTTRRSLRSTKINYLDPPLREKASLPSPRKKRSSRGRAGRKSSQGAEDDETPAMNEAQEELEEPPPAPLPPKKKGGAQKKKRSGERAKKAGSLVDSESQPGDDEIQVPIEPVRTQQESCEAAPKTPSQTSSPKKAKKPRSEAAKASTMGFSSPFISVLVAFTLVFSALFTAGSDVLPAIPQATVPAPVAAEEPNSVTSHQPVAAPAAESDCLAVTSHLETQLAEHKNALNLAASRLKALESSMSNLVDKKEMEEVLSKMKEQYALSKQQTDAAQMQYSKLAEDTEKGFADVRASLDKHAEFVSMDSRADVSGEPAVDRLRTETLQAIESLGGGLQARVMGVEEAIKRETWQREETLQQETEQLRKALDAGLATIATSIEASIEDSMAGPNAEVSEAQIRQSLSAAALHADDGLLLYDHASFGNGGRIILHSAPYSLAQPNPMEASVRGQPQQENESVSKASSTSASVPAPLSGLASVLHDLVLGEESFEGLQAWAQDQTHPAAQRLLAFAGFGAAPGAEAEQQGQELRRKLQSYVRQAVSAQAASTSAGSPRAVNAATALLQPSLMPGQGWSFRGSRGWVLLRTSAPLMLKMAQLSHPPLAVFDPALSGDHAPKLYRISALEESAVRAALGVNDGANQYQMLKTQAVFLGECEYHAVRNVDYASQGTASPSANINAQLRRDYREQEQAVESAHLTQSCGVLSEGGGVDAAGRQAATTSYQYFLVDFEGATSSASHTTVFRLQLHSTQQ